MEQNQEAVFSLVKSLSPAESKGFEKTLLKYDLKKRKNSSLILFRTLLKMKEYKLERVKLKTNTKIPAENLSAVKSQLKRRLIEYLREQNNHYSREWNHMLEEAQLLCSRGILGEAQAIIDKVKLLAKEANQKHYVAAALFIEKLTIQRLRERELISAAFHMADEMDDITRNLHLTSQFFGFYSKIVTLTLKGLLVRDDETLQLIEQLKQDEVLNSDIATLSLEQKHILLASKLYLARLCARYEEAYAYASQHLQLIENNIAYFRKYYLHQIPSVYLGHAEASLLLASPKKWKAAIAQYKSYLEKNMPDDRLHKGFYYFHHYAYLIKYGSIQQLEKHLRQLETFYKKEGQHSILVKMQLEMALIFGYYRQKNYEKALDYCRIALDEKKNEVAGDIKDIVRLITLIIRFDKLLKADFTQTEIYAFDSFTDSEYHFFRQKKKGDYRLERTLIDFFRAALKNHNTPALKKEIKLLREKLNALILSNTLYIKHMDNSFNLIEWIDGILSYLKKGRERGTKDEGNTNTSPRR